MPMPPAIWGNGIANYKLINGKRNYTAMKVSHKPIPKEKIAESNKRISKIMKKFIKEDKKKQAVSLLNAHKIIIK